MADGRRDPMVRRVVLRLDRDLAEALEVEAKDQERSISFLIRKCLAREFGPATGNEKAA
jgi:predicted HicB family RNase H-like nuclease